MEYLDNECKFCGGEIIDDPDTGNKICKHCGAEFFDKSRKQATSILGRFNIQNTSPQQNNQQQIKQQEQQSNEPEKQLSALEQWELEHAKNEKKYNKFKIPTYKNADGT